MTQEHQNHKQKKYKRRNRSRRLIVLLEWLLIIGVLAGGICGWLLIGPTLKHMDQEAYFNFCVSREAGSDRVLLEDEAAVLLQDHFSGAPARLINGYLYLDYEMARANLNDRFFRDETNAMLIYTDAYRTFEIPQNSNSYTIDGEMQSYETPIYVSDERGAFISADFLQLYTNMVCEVSPDQRHVKIEYVWGERLTGKVKKKTPVRFKADRKGEIVTQITSGELVQVLEQYDAWSRIVTESGFIGYIPNKRMSEPAMAEFSREFEEPEYPSLRLEEKVNLVWHQIGIMESNDYLEQDTAAMTGVNVISPTWFSLSDNEGNFESLASKSYVKKAHKKGWQVWGLVSNFSPDMSTTTLLESTAARRNLANNLVNAALEYDLDGINVDLEAIAESAGYGYVQFIRELSILCRKQGLVLSVDVPEPFSFNWYYNWKELGAVADYVILMGYDEHYVGSEAGSVASLAFEENGIIETLKDVPKEKLIGGIPFYSRLWYSQNDGSLWSEVIGMNSAANTVANYGAQVVWNEETQQNYAEWMLDDGIFCQIWMEDAQSIALKAGLVGTYDLGGVAAWALGSETADIWQVITDAIA